VLRLYEERGRSGKNALRPEFQQLTRDANAGLFDVIIVHKLDRFSRSVVDMFSYLKGLKVVNSSLVSVTEDFDFTTPIGKVLLALLSAFAEWYLDNLGNEITKGRKNVRGRDTVMAHYRGGGYTTPKTLREKLVKLREAYKAASIARSKPI
jgi:site-specific DNA recombinase